MTSSGERGETVSSSVPPTIASAIKADAAKDDRSESYIIRRILEAHYAPRGRVSGRAQKIAA